MPLRYSKLLRLPTHCFMALLFVHTKHLAPPCVTTDLNRHQVCHRSVHITNTKQMFDIQTAHQGQVVSLMLDEVSLSFLGQ